MRLPTHYTACRFLLLQPYYLQTVAETAACFLPNNILRLRYFTYYTDLAFSLPAFLAVVGDRLPWMNACSSRRHSVRSAITRYVSAAALFYLPASIALAAWL